MRQRRVKGKSANIRDKQDWGSWFSCPTPSDLDLQKERDSGLLQDVHSVFRNSKYIVLLQQRDCAVIVVKDGQAVATGQVTQALIRRVDAKPIHNWRDLQRIKAELFGPEQEAVELYPAQSRLIDDCNWYHLWVLPDDAIMAMGYGWKDSVTQTEDSECKVSVHTPEEDEDEDIEEDDPRLQGIKRAVDTLETKGESPAVIVLDEEQDSSEVEYDGHNVVSLEQPKIHNPNTKHKCWCGKPSVSLSGWCGHCIPEQLHNSVNED
jgi:hypothetical protein